jgi:hypothetical protein
VNAIVQQNQEFSIQNEDFPALPGYKGVVHKGPLLISLCTVDNCYQSQLFLALCTCISSVIFYIFDLDSYIHNICNHSALYDNL